MLGRVKRSAKRGDLGDGNFACYGMVCGHCIKCLGLYSIHAMFTKTCYMWIFGCGWGCKQSGLGVTVPQCKSSK